MKKIFSLCMIVSLISFQMIAKVVNRTITTVPVGDTPAGIAIIPDGTKVYVANNNNDNIANGDSISVIDVESNSLITTIHDASFNEPYTVTIDKTGSKAYVSNSGGITLSVIEIASNSVIHVINGFHLPSGVAITPDGLTAYVNNYGDNANVSGNGTTVSVVDLKTKTIVGAPIVVDLAPAAIAMSPNGSKVYVACYTDGNPGTGTVNIISTSSNQVIGTITGFSGPFQIVLSPDGSRAYVSNFGSNNFAPYGTTVSVVDLKKKTIIQNIQVGVQPAALALSPDGKLLYVTIYNTLYFGPNFTDLRPLQAKVVIIDLTCNKVLCPEPLTGASPAGIVITPDGCKAYVTNYSDNNVSVINVCDKMWLPSVC